MSRSANRFCRREHDRRYPLGEAPLRSRLLGEFNVANLLAALGSMLALHVPLADAVVALQQIMPAPGRLQTVNHGGNEPLVVVDYAHTPDALERY